MQSLSAFSFAFLVTKKNFTLKSSLVLLYLGYWILLICLVMDIVVQEKIYTIVLLNKVVLMCQWKVLQVVLSRSEGGK